MNQEVFPLNEITLKASPLRGRAGQMFESTFGNTRILRRYLVAIATLFTGYLMSNTTCLTSVAQRRRLCKECVNTKVELIGRELIPDKLVGPCPQGCTPPTDGTPSTGAARKCLTCTGKWVHVQTELFSEDGEWQVDLLPSSGSCRCYRHCPCRSRAWEVVKRCYQEDVDNDTDKLSKLLKDFKKWKFDAESCPNAEASYKAYDTIFGVGPDYVGGDCKAYRKNMIAEITQQRNFFRGPLTFSAVVAKLGDKDRGRQNSRHRLPILAGTETSKPTTPKGATPVKLKPAEAALTNLVGALGSVPKDQPGLKAFKKEVITKVQAACAA